MSEYTEYYVIPTQSIQTVWSRLEAEKIRSAIYKDAEEIAAWDKQPENRRFAVVYTLDVKLERLGELFGRALWLLVDENPARWRMDLQVDGERTRFLFSDVPWGDHWEEGDEALIAASLTPQEHQLALVERFFGVPRADVAPLLRVGGLRRFCKATGMPLHIPTDQRCLEWLIEEGRFETETVVSYEDLD